MDDVKKEYVGQSFSFDTTNNVLDAVEMLMNHEFEIEKRSFQECYYDTKDMLLLKRGILLRCQLPIIDDEFYDGKTWQLRVSQWNTFDAITLTINGSDNICKYLKNIGIHIKGNDLNNVFNVNLCECCISRYVFHKKNIMARFTIDLISVCDNYYITGFIGTRFGYFGDRKVILDIIKNFLSNSKGNNIDICFKNAPKYVKDVYETRVFSLDTYYMIHTLYDRGMDELESLICATIKIHHHEINRENKFMISQDSKNLLYGPVSGIDTNKNKNSSPSKLPCNWTDHVHINKINTI